MSKDRQDTRTGPSEATCAKLAKIWERLALTEEESVEEPAV